MSVFVHHWSLVHLLFNPSVHPIDFHTLVHPTTHPSVHLSIYPSIQLSNSDNQCGSSLHSSTLSLWLSCVQRQVSPLMVHLTQPWEQSCLPSLLWGSEYTNLPAAFRHFPTVLTAFVRFSFGAHVGSCRVPRPISSSLKRVQSCHILGMLVRAQLWRQDID